MNSPTLPDFMDRLIVERDRLETRHMREMFASQPTRFQEMSVRHDGLVFDYSKNRLDDQAFKLLIQIAEVAHVSEARDAMFGGDKINSTEGRAVLHTALRNRSGNPVELDGEDVMSQVRAVLAQMADFANAVRSGAYQLGGGAVTDVVNIGIGGSDSGPKMVTQTLKAFHDGPRVHFVSNVDASDLDDTLEALNPETTLFIIASKSFTTAETMRNAKRAKAWIKAAAVQNSGEHFCALSTNLKATREFGVADECTFAFWDWVGGRYSVWSAIGLSVMMAIGPKSFDEFLEGAHSADQHFLQKPLHENIPVIMALLGMWYRNVWKFPAYAVLPYDNRMAKLPAWLQQLDMESNGKSVLKSGEKVIYATGPIVFGEPGTNGQHAFYQLIHQGTDIIPCDFLVAARGDGSEESRNVLIANCFAQSEALMTGRTLQEAGNNPHCVFEGNRPSNTFLYEELTPYTLGMLMAFYEHKTFVQGVIWGINSFDQWGVELGKDLAGDVHAMLEEDNVSNDASNSTQGLLNVIKAMKKQ